MRNAHSIDNLDSTRRHQVVQVTTGGPHAELQAARELASCDRAGAHDVLQDQHVCFADRARHQLSPQSAPKLEAPIGRPLSVDTNTRPSELNETRTRTPR